MGAESADDLIQQGDVYYAKLQANEALKYYLPAEKLDPDNVRLLLRISRQYRHLMSDASQPKEKLVLGNTAVSYAERAVAWRRTIRRRNWPSRSATGRGCRSRKPSSRSPTRV
jgi:hypothetical protein